MTLTLLIFIVTTSFFKTENTPPDSTAPVIQKLSTTAVNLIQVNALPAILREASGLEFAGGLWWSHNDDGKPVLYGFDGTGRVITAIHINGVNRGWEDLAQDEAGNLYIGSFGNNSNDRRDLRIYKIPPPDDIGQQPVTPQLIRYTYEDQNEFPPPPSRRNFDVDAFFALNGHLYLITKSRVAPANHYAHVYRLSQQPGDQTAKLIDSVFVGKNSGMNNWVTGADISPDGRVIALLFHDRLLFISGFRDDAFSSGALHELPLGHYSHKTGICFLTDETVYLLDELEFGIIGGKLYIADLSAVREEMNER